MNAHVRPSLGPRAQALQTSLAFAGELKPRLERSYLVKGWLGRGELSMLVGPSNVGKSFLAIDLAHHVAKGLPWHGVRVTAGPVLYVAAEGAGGFVNRVAALHEPKFWVLPVPVTLIGRESSDADPLAELVADLARVHGRYALIVVDTMARVMGGADENAGPDIADLLRNLDLLRSRTGAHVLLVHHSGKDRSRGARGHSSLRAAVDTEITLSRDSDGRIVATVDKQRDGATGGKFGYRLRRVELGLDQDGEAVASCVVEPAEAGEAGEAGSTLPGAAAAVLEVLDGLLAGGEASVSEPFLRKACLTAGVSPANTPDAQRMAFNRGMAALAKAGLIRVEGGTVERVQP